VREQRRVLLVKRTGWGKSVVYFVATKLLREEGSGPVLIISPLIALMRNQLELALKLGLRAERLDSQNEHDWARVFEGLDRDDTDLLLVSPERLANREFLERQGQGLFAKLGMLVVDEAHCVSDWGHDFRPHYRRIAQFARYLPGNVPMLATTATADDRVIEDVRRQLGEDVGIVRGTLSRESLHLDVISGLSYAERLAWISKALPNMPGSGIIYTLTKRDANIVAEWLRERGVDAQAYHADVDDVLREEREQLLLRNELKALVATTALGMGYDKSDIGFVLHFQSTQSVIHYYQMVGRAGRAIDNAYCILLTGREDDEIIESFIRNALPSQDIVEKILSALEDRNLSIPQLMAQVNAPRGKIDAAIEFLSLETPSPIVKIDRSWSRTAVDYAYPIERAQSLANRRREDRATMSAYERAERCLMRTLVEHLGDETVACGRCSVCIGSALVSVGDLDDEIALAEDFLAHREIVLPIRKQWPQGGLPNFGFPSGGRIGEGLVAGDGRALCYFQVGRIGRRLRSEKYLLGHFSEQTVQQAADLIRSWNPQPPPQWIVPMPSLNRPELVPGFAERLGDVLDIPVHRVLKKLRTTEEQKGMENSSFQASNLDGSLAVDHFEGMEQPGLFVDDMYDSGWTVAVAVALLRRAGAGVVYPFTLSKAAGRE
jgi:ATP-dependent DNA helicase RecQ